MYLCEIFAAHCYVATLMKHFRSRPDEEERQRTASSGDTGLR